MEFSDLLIQIVDARNPEAFFCNDLFLYTKEVSVEKQTLLLINKADLLAPNQRYTLCLTNAQYVFNFQRGMEKIFN